MKKTFILAFLLSLCLSLFSYAQSEEEGWKLSKENEGIEVYVRTIPETKYRQYRGVMEMELPPQSFVKLIKDDSAATEWVNRAVSFKTFETLSENEWYTYTEISIPWPFNNKDLVTYNWMEKEEATNTIRIFIEGKPNYYPEQENKSRIPHTEGEWQLKPLENGKTEIRYTVFAKSSGGLPPWIVTPIVVGGIYSTLEDMREVVKREKYIFQNK